MYNIYTISLYVYVLDFRKLKASSEIQRRMCRNGRYMGGIDVMNIRNLYYFVNMLPIKAVFKFALFDNIIKTLSTSEVDGWSLIYNVNFLLLHGSIFLASTHVFLKDSRF